MLTGDEEAKGTTAVAFNGKVAKEQLADRKQVWTWKGQWKNKKISLSILRPRAIIIILLLLLHRPPRSQLKEASRQSLQLWWNQDAASLFMDQPLLRPPSQSEPYKFLTDQPLKRPLKAGFLGGGSAG